MFEPIIDVLQANPTFFLCLMVAMGLMVGSFLNVVIFRYPIMLERLWQQEANAFLEAQNAEKAANEATLPSIEMQKTQEEKPFNLITPRSTCPTCKSAIKPWDNIPIISYVLFLRGKCQKCKAPISLRYPLVELGTAILSGLVVYQLGFSAQAFAALFVTWILIALSMIDYDHKILPDDFTLPLMWAGILFNSTSYGFVSLHTSVLGAVGGYLSLWSVFWLFKFVTGKEGMGFGDFKLLAALGAWAGWQAIPVIILYSSFTGSIIGLSLIFITQRNKNNPIPFGPYLAISGWLVLLWNTALPFYTMPTL